MRAADGVGPTLPRLPAGRIVGEALRAGFQEARLLRSADLPVGLREHPQLAALGRGCYLMVALSCYRREPEDLSAPGDPHALLAPFARRNYYREAVGRLKPLVRELSGVPGLERSRARVFSNSRLPEKPLAVAAGLGFMGRNGLVIAPGLGSLFVIAGAFLPLDLDEAGGGSATAATVATAAQIGSGCGSCRACQEACPGGALTGPGRLDEARCLQALAGRAVTLGEPARRAWGRRLYGCQSCQEVCPYNRALDWESPTALGELGPSLSIRELLGLGAVGLRERLRVTPMGMSWVDPRALLRNLLLAAGHSGEPAMVEALRPYRDGADRLLRGAAEWAAARLAGGEGRGAR